MKHTIILSLIYLLLACQDKSQPIEPIEEIPSVVIEDSLVSYATKEPYVKIEDTGFEAFLIASNVDKDNQINGKTALEDIEMVETINVPYNENRTIINSEFLKKVSLLQKKYKSRQLLKDIPIVIKNSKDIEHLKNLKHLELNLIYFAFDTDTMDFSKNINLEKIIGRMPSKIKFINVKGCKNLTHINLGATYYWQGGYNYPLQAIDLSDNINLEELHYISNITTIDLSENINLKILDLRGCESLGEINLCNNSKLESVQTTNSSIKNIYVSKEVFARIDTLKTFVAEGLTLPLWAKNTNAQWGVCK